MPSGPRPVALDAEALARLRRTMGTEGEYRDMLEEFLRASSRVLRDLEQAASASRWSDAERAAHTLKSMARMVGALELADACADAERAATRPPLDGAAVHGVARHVEVAKEAVQACLG